MESSRLLKNGTNSCKRCWKNTKKEFVTVIRLADYLLEAERALRLLISNLYYVCLHSISTSIGTNVHKFYGDSKI